MILLPVRLELRSILIFLIFDSIVFSEHKWKPISEKRTVTPMPEQQPSSSPPRASLTSSGLVEVSHQTKLGTAKDKVRGKTNGSADYLHPKIPRNLSGASHSSQSEMQADSSDIESSESELEEREFSKHEPDFELVRNRKRFSGQKGKQGKDPKIN